MLSKGKSSFQDLCTKLSALKAEINCTKFEVNCIGGLFSRSILSFAEVKTNIQRGDLLILPGRKTVKVEDLLIFKFSY